MLNDEPRTIDEAYLSACSTSDLRMAPVPDRVKDLDHIAQSGMNAHRFGGALKRLQHEWDAASKPLRPTPAILERLAASYPRLPSGLVIYREVSVVNQKEVVREVQITPPEAALRDAECWYQHEARILLGQLKGLPLVRAQLKFWAETVLGETDGVHVACSVLEWWLDKTCRTCLGVKWRVAAGTGRTTGRVCGKCRGSGESKIPHEANGKRMLKYMSDSLSSWKDHQRGVYEHHRP